MILQIKIYCYLFQLVMKHRASGGIKTIICLSLRHMHVKVKDTHAGDNEFNLLNTWRDRQKAGGQMTKVQSTLLISNY